MRSETITMYLMIVSALLCVWLIWTVTMKLKEIKNKPILDIAEKQCEYRDGDFLILKGTVYFVNLNEKKVKPIGKHI